MTSVSLDPETFQLLINRFATELPGILAGHQTVADLALRSKQLLNSAETPFTLAFVGQMRSGKSSLINALIGADLAVTGVNETTATINWFRYGSPDRAGTFRVVWKDRPAEEFPISEIQNWVGDSERARCTRQLDFFADVPFLRKANIVDTPGTRSVLADHSRATEEFLAIRQEKDTKEAGEAADAVVYVLPPVAREADSDFLAEFEKATRIQGSSPYNSLAVVHKWETQEATDPYANALRKCERVKNALDGQVSIVIPVSAPLGRAAEKFSHSYWADIFGLYAGTKPDVLDDLLLTEKDFLSWEEPLCPLNSIERKTLRISFQLPWPSFKALFAIARHRKPNDPQELRAIISEVSGISSLRQTIDLKFLTRSRLIKAFSVLGKGLEPAQIAATRLRNHKQKQFALLEDADRRVLPRLLSAIKAGATGLEPVLQYVEETRNTITLDAFQASEILKRLGDFLVPVKDAFTDLDADMKMLQSLDNNSLPGEWQNILRDLFGANGTSLSDRLASVGKNLEAVDSLLGKVHSELNRSAPETKKIFEHAHLRLQQMADFLDS